MLQRGESSSVGRAFGKLLVYLISSAPYGGIVQAPRRRRVEIDARGTRGDIERHAVHRSASSDAVAGRCPRGEPGNRRMAALMATERALADDKAWAEPVSPKTL